jgi:serine/threonine protein kinase
MFTGIVPHGTGYKTIGAVAPEFAYIDQLIDQMIKNDPSDRPSSIEAIKKELLLRGNEFIVLQTLNSKTNEVVHECKPDEFEQIQITNADWSNNHISFTLNRNPESEWTQRFKSPTSGYSCPMGSGPESFRFVGNKAIVPAEAHIIEDVVASSKRLLEMANRDYANDLIYKASEKEQAFKNKLKQEQAELKAKAEILGKLKNLI